MISRISSRLALLGATAVLAVGLTTGAMAQTYSKEHLAAARAAIAAAKVTEGFDEILIGIAAQTKQALVRRAPAASTQIEEVTNAAALELAPKRAELAQQIQEIWAGRFTKEELDEIAKFYSSPVGQKFTKEIPAIGQMIGMSAQVWQKKISEEMLTKVRAEMKKRGVDL
ncbi:DUF2059 domain-containing protein [Pinisolibacter sp.]|uniref:DUF2059 domain-containing protein n=1 Tax=Pinisolibacter sp. TaxID=2172024 RepID=UPI002FDCC481